MSVLDGVQYRQQQQQREQEEREQPEQQQQQQCRDTWKAVNLNFLL